MKLKVKNFNWLAGRPVVILDERTAEKLHTYVDDRVSIFCSNSKKKIYAVVDIFSKLVKENEIGLSNEISSILKLKPNSSVEVESSEISTASSLIKKKLLGKRLSKEEINLLVSEIVRNNLTEVELAYFVAAEKLNGMSLNEIINLTKAMINSGTILKFNKKIIADKHSIGGIAGNRTTPIIVSICAATGLTIPKTSSRAITSAAGTADVIETVSKVEFSPNQIKRIISKTNACLVWGGSLNLAPSDDKIIQVEKLLNLDVEPQLLASIISKKIAAGSNYILIDIPYGKSSKVQSKRQAKKLGKHFQKLAKHFNITLKIVYTNGSQPIGSGIGPNLEMIDIIKVLKNDLKAPQDLRQKSINLSIELLKLCKVKNPKKTALEILESGKAYEKFKQIIITQNTLDKKSRFNFEQTIKKLRPAKFSKTIRAKKSGKIKEIDNKKINSLCKILGTPESKSAGVYLHTHVGKIKKNKSIITLYSESKQKLQDALKFYKEFKPITIK